MERRRKWAWPLLWLRFIFYSIFCFPSWTWRLSTKKLRNTLTRIVPVKFKALVQVTLWFCLNWLGIEASQALMCWSQCLRANCCSSFFNFAFSDSHIDSKKSTMLGRFTPIEILECYKARLFSHPEIQHMNTMFK